jgi:hypothetical protein
VAMSVMYPLDNIKFRMQCRFLIIFFIKINIIIHIFEVEDSAVPGKTPVEALIYILKKEGM